MNWLQLGSLCVGFTLGSPLAAGDEGVKAGEKAGEKVAEKTAAKVEAGKPAPDFTLKDQDGKDVKLSRFQGKKGVLIAFYPRDFTGG